ncbi:alpha/beta hydrolase [Bradyrhizobium japonicum]|uniref:alpha/beta hydrolase n=1 Tax=Bradyrhizobium japonicum TaxID=375 RepID=UPI001FD95650|nr:alpha/beta hydrolase [Bradyrhizobium japonicum]
MVASRRSKLKNVMLVAPDVDVDVFRSQLSRMRGARPSNLPVRLTRRRRVVAVEEGRRRSPGRSIRARSLTGASSRATGSTSTT